MKIANSLLLAATCALPLLVVGRNASAQSWKPVPGNIMSCWAKQISPDNVWPEYPRPQMVRDEWMNLNGLWGYAIRPRDAVSPGNFDGHILVPFCAESALSGVKRTVGPDNRLWYRRLFEVPDEWDGQRVLLHFGAVDWETTVSLNGRQLGVHRGGYDSFSFDVTDALRPDGLQELTVVVWDPTDAGTGARGKQVREPKGIWYTAVTGIWQTVWLEPVPETAIQSLHIVPDIDNDTVSLTAHCQGTTDDDIAVFTIIDGDRIVKSASDVPNAPVSVKLPSPKLWSPDSPFLYRLKVSLEHKGEVVDTVNSYFGMRKTSVMKDDDGILRLALNNEIGFQYGPLDQGWWPDGLYTAPTDDALRYDIEMTKKLGFNMIRKHVKIEPARWYYHCDKLGMLVWQDMPNANRRKQGNEERDKQFEAELKALVDGRRNHPCIIVWVPFNEGWGQYDTERITAWLQEYDPSRLVNPASGWTDKGCGDLNDLHSYPNPRQPKPEEKRAIVQGEFGGLGLPVEGHLWWNKRNWGYRTYTANEELARNYEQVVRRLRGVIGAGTCAGVYTQTTDCEGEVNGLMTYDRAVLKFDPDWMAEVNCKLYLPPPLIKTIVPTSEAQGQTWRYTTKTPPAGWEQPNFDDSSWKQAVGGFGKKDTPGAVVRTEWHTSDIWMRRTFDLNSLPADPQLRIHHDEDAEVYLNGKQVATFQKYTTSYVEEALSEGAAALRSGSNTVAVHCQQTRGGQYIDVGIVEVRERSD